MTPHRLEFRLRRELRGLRPEPSRALRGRILAALEQAPSCGASAAEVDPAGARALRTSLRHAAALAASLLLVIGVRTATSEAPIAPPAPLAEPVVLAWSTGLDDSASDWEAGLLAQADQFAADARSAADAFLDRIPAAPWAKRTDGDH